MSLFQPKLLLSKLTPSRREEESWDVGAKGTSPFHTRLVPRHPDNHSKPAWAIAEPAGTAGGGGAGSGPCGVVVGLQTCMECFAVLVCSDLLPILKQIILVCLNTDTVEEPFIFRSQRFFSSLSVNAPALETMQKKISTLGKYPPQP